MNYIDISNTIKSKRLELGLTLEEVANRVGVAKSTVKKWESGAIANMRRDKISALAQALNTTPSFILFGKDEERTPKNIYPVTAYVKLQKVGIIHAGQPILAEQEEYGEWAYADEKYGDGNHFMLDVVGDSMTPTIPNGATVIVRKQDYANNGDIVAFAMDGEYATLKRYFRQPNGNILLRGDNPSADCYVITQQELQMGEAFIIGVAVECKFKLS